MRPIDADALKEVLQRNFGHTGGAAGVDRQYGRRQENQTQINAGGKPMECLDITKKHAESIAPNWGDWSGRTGLPVCGRN